MHPLKKFIFLSVKLVLHCTAQLLLVNEQPNHSKRLNKLLTQGIKKKIS